MKTDNILLKIKREQMIEAGAAYDGRYKVRVVEDKKKKELNKRIKIRPHTI